MVETTLDGRLEFLRRQLHAITLATQDAKARNDQTTIDTLTTLYKKVQSDLVALQADALKAESPSAFMLSLSSFSDEMIKTGVQLRDAGANIVGGLGSTLKYLPVILLAALVIVGLVFAGKIRKGLK